MILNKSHNANLENLRTIFFETGMIITLLLVFLAINWKTYEKKVIQSYDRAIDNTPVEMVPVTQQKPPEPPKIQAPVIVTAINIVDDDIEVDEDFKIDAEAEPMDSIQAYVPVPVMKEEENAVEEEIFRVVESAPEFPGGEEALYDYLAKNMRYPDMAKEAGISGKVFLTFVVEKDGSITDVQLLRGIGGGCDEEAIRVVQKMPTWAPGRQRNIPVRVQYNLPIKFTLQLR